MREWYRRSYPEMGYLVEERPFGWYSRHTSAPHVGRVTLRDIAPDHVPALLSDTRAYYRDAPVTLYLDDRAADAALRPALEAAGCTVWAASSYLAYVGPRREPPAFAGLTIEAANGGRLRDYVITKIKGFANSDDDPPEQDVIDELSLRQAELADAGRFLIGRIAGVPAATVGWYSTGVAHIFQLATRVSFRRRGIATALLRHVLCEELSKGAQAVVIDADEDDRPIDLYRRLGFTDEVYWRRPYRVPVG